MIEEEVEERVDEIGRKQKMKGYRVGSKGKDCTIGVRKIKRNKRNYEGEVELPLINRLY